MRMLIVVALVAVILAAHWSSPPRTAAQEQPGSAPEPSAPLDQEEADHAALREFKALFEKAAAENQLDLLKPLLHEPFSVVTYTDREFTDFEAFKARWQKTRDEIVGNGSYKVTLKPERSEIYGDLAIARGDSENVLVTAAGNEYHFTSHWTAVFRKQDSQWKVVRVHSSLDPFGNPMVIGEAKQRMVQAGVGAGVAGLLVGGILAYLLARRGGRSSPGTTQPS
jgi:ketosteroid isomerase-like protein